MSAERAPSRLGHRPALDGVRALAILLVILYHDARRLRGGFLGVDVFFVLSGFLITGVLLEEWDATGAIRLARFYTRRLLRLAPALVAFVVVAYAVTHFVEPTLAGRLPDRWAAAALLYVTNLLAAYGREYPLGLVSIHWSLAIEEQFYLLWPVCLRLLLRSGLSRDALAATVFLASLVPTVLRAALLAQAPDDGKLWLRLYFAPDTRADSLLVGCTLALLLLSRPAKQPLAGAASALVGALVLGGLAATRDLPDVTRSPFTLGLIAWASAGLLFGVWQGGGLARLFEWPPLVWIGRLSYSLYLWHMIGLDLARGRGVAAKAALLLALAATSHYLVERPFLAVKARFSPGAAGVPAARLPLRTLLGRPAAGLILLGLIVGVGYKRQVASGASGRAEEAAQHLAEQPDDPHWLNELGTALVEARDFKSALPLLERAVRLHPSHAQLRTSLGLALRALGRREEARRRIGEAVLLDPRYARAHCAQGELFLDEDRLGEAIAAFTRSLALDPDSAPCHNGTGIAYALSGDEASAVRHFEAAAKIRPDPATLANLERAKAALRNRAPR